MGLHALYKCTGDTPPWVLLGPFFVYVSCPSVKDRMQLYRLFSRFTVGFRRKNGPLVFFFLKKKHSNIYTITSTIPAPVNPHTIIFLNTKLSRPCFSFICGTAPTFSAPFSFSFFCVVLVLYLISSCFFSAFSSAIWTENNKEKWVPYTFSTAWWVC